MKTTIVKNFAFFILLAGAFFYGSTNQRVDPYTTQWIEFRDSTSVRDTVSKKNPTAITNLNSKFPSHISYSIHNESSDYRLKVSCDPSFPSGATVIVPKSGDYKSEPKATANCSELYVAVDTTATLKAFYDMTIEGK